MSPAQNPPEQPEQPEPPDAPDAPDAPEAREAPDVPEAPEAPATPEAPGLPATPDAPGTPRTSGTPKTPDTPPTPAAPQAPGAAPWVRTRLRAAPGGAVALALLVLVTAFLAAAFPRGVDTYEDREARRLVTGAAATERNVALTLPPDPEVLFEDRLESMSAKAVAAYARPVQREFRDPLRARTGQVSYGVRTRPVLVADDPWLPRTDGQRPEVQLDARAGVGERARVVDGRLPEPTAYGASGAAGGGAGARADEVVFEAAVSAATADELNIRVGSRLHLPQAEGTLVVHVTGIVEPKAPRSDYWSVDPLLRTPELRQRPASLEPQRYWTAALLLHPGSGPALFAGTQAYDLSRDEPATGPYWNVPVAGGALTGRDVPAVLDALSGLQEGPAYQRLTERIGTGLDVSTDAAGLLNGYTGLRDAVTPVVAVAAFGVGAVAAVVLGMGGGLAASRRRAELALLRSRGGSLRGIAVRLLAENAAVVLPAAAAGYGLAALLLPAGRHGPALLAAGATALLALCALPALAVAAVRRPRPGVRTDLVRARPSRRRLVAELTAVVLAVGAIVVLRRRGSADGGADALVSAAPVLVGAVAAAVFVRLYPLPLRLAARPAAWARGALGFLSLARAGRAPAASALPLLALLVALTTASFGGSVLAGVADARATASLYRLGGDARLTASAPLPDGVAARAAKAGGVRHAASVGTENGLQVIGLSGDLTLLTVDAGTYAKLSADLGLGEFDAGRLRDEGGGRALPALVSPGVAELIGDGTLGLQSSRGRITAEVAEVRRVTPALTGGEFAVVDAASVARQLPGTAGLPEARPDTLLLSAAGGGLDHAALRTLARDSAPGATLLLRDDVVDDLAASELQRGAERLYAAAAVAATGYALLAVLLSLLRAAPERVALLARLRTMGFSRRHGRGLLVLEALPQLVAAGLAGALAGLVTVRLLGPGIDLGALALGEESPGLLGAGGADGGAELRADPLALALPSVAVPALALAAVLVQAWWGGRRRAVQELRAGERE
jgi:putative ABC transport system permease protein